MLSETKKTLLRIAAPAVAGFLSLIIYELVDIFWIARLGTDAVAGVASAEYWGWVLQSFMMMTTVGCTTLVSQAVGAEDPERSHQAVREAAHLSLLISVVLAFAAYAAAPQLLRWMGLNEAAFSAGLTYFRIIISMLPMLHLILLGNQVFNAHGDTKTAVLTMTAALSVNAIMDPILIFGWLGFPAYGVAGAAYATACGWTTGLLLRLIFLRRRGYIGPLATFLSFSSGLFRMILRVGTPTAASRLIWASVYPLLTTIVTRFGMIPLAGMTISHRIESIAYFTCMGFSIAAATVVGQRVGAGDHEGARSAAYEARTMITWILVPISALFVLVPEHLLALVTRDPETIAEGVRYLRTIGLLEIFLGWETVFEGAFSGLGNTRPYMYISIPLTLGRYPAAWFMVTVLHMGVEAVWWSIAVSTLLKGLLMSLTFRRTLALPQT